MTPPPLLHPRRSAGRFALALSCLLAVAPAARLGAHDSFMRLDDYDLEVGKPTTIYVLHGTFDESAYDPHRGWIDTVVDQGPDGTPTPVPLDSWARWPSESRVRGWFSTAISYLGIYNHRKASTFEYVPRSEGTHAIAMAFITLGVALPTANFNAYLEEYGLDELPVGKHGITDPAAVFPERWTKYIKVIVQCGEKKTDNILTPVGQPAEIVPGVHPATVHPGDKLPLLMLVDGEPLANHPVIAGRARGFLEMESPPHIRLQSDADGMVSLPIDTDGEWWIGFVDLKRTPPGDEVDYESKWASLTINIE